MTDAPLVAPEEVRTFLAGLREPVALTGGTGFVGSHLVDTLCAAGVRPRVLVRDPECPRWISGRDVELVPGSLEDAGSLERLVAGARTVLHLAGVVRAPSSDAFLRANREGTRRLVDAARRAAAPDARLVYVSSQAALGPAPEIAGLGPEAEPRPVSAYGRSKLGGEEAVRGLGDRREWVILRPPAIYGPRDTDVYQFFRMAARGLAAIPAGERWITVAFVGDVVRAVLAAATGGVAGRVLHLGEPWPYRLEALVRLLGETGGVRVRVVRVPALLVRAAGVGGSLLHTLGLRRIAMTRDKARELLARHWTMRTADSLEALGMGELTGFPDGARLTWAWYRNERWIG